MAIKMSEKLLVVVEKLGIKEENILYMNIQRPFLERILSEEKKVEFRDLSEYWLKKLNNYNKDKSYKSRKPIKYILFQNGMKSEGAPRVLVEYIRQVEKWGKDANNPAEIISNCTNDEKYRMTIKEGKEKYSNVFIEAEREGFDVKDDNEEFLALELGKIIYREHI